MKARALTNPFVINGKYVSEEYFCDRKKETTELVSNILNGRNTVLVSARRMGKSGLIEHTFSQAEIKNAYYTFYVDIFSTSSLEEFVFLLGKEILSRLLPKGQKIRNRFLSVVNSIKVALSLDPLTGMPSFEFSLGDITDPQKTLEQIFHFLENSEMPCVVAIDEFQQLAEYPDGAKLLAGLRSGVQSCKQTGFVFAGSNRRMMGELFNTPSQPFFMSCVPLYLETIDYASYQDFARYHFNKAGKEISSDSFKYIYNKFGGHTWYVQCVLNRLFEVTRKGYSTSVESAEAAVEYLLDVYDHTFQEILAGFPDRQKRLLIAMAKNGPVSGLTSASFITKFKLRTASSVQGAAKPLLANETILLEDGNYRISNRFFALWLDRRY